TEPTPMRLFVALVPSAAARDHLARTVAPVERDNRDLRWAAHEMWHLTLAFYPSVPDGELHAMATRLRAAAAAEPVRRLRLNAVGAFPAPRSARVLWVGVHSDQPLSRLAERVRTCTEGYRELTERRFHPHLTLARVPPGHQPEARRVLSRLDGYQGPEWPGPELQLIS